MDQALKQMQPTNETATDAPEFDFANWMDSVKTLIPEAQADSISKFEGQLAKTENPQDQVQLNKNLSEIWQRLRLPGPTAYHIKQMATIEKNAQNWIDSGEQFFVASRLTQNPQLQQYFGIQSEQSLNEALKIEPENIRAKISLAKTYVDAQNQVMQGVLLLREVEKAEPDNLEMNVTLGRLSMISQQYEKAVKRMEKVLSLEPENTEALYYLGEASLKLGDPDRAISLFKQCKDLVDNPAFKLELDNYIKQIVINK